MNAVTAVMVDRREPEWVRALAFEGAPVLTTLLDCGDVWATASSDNALILVERKTSDDLLGSLKDERLWEQLSALRARSVWSYLVVTGTLERSKRGMVITERGETAWNWASVMGALLRAQELGVAVLLTTPDDFEATVLRLAARERHREMVIPPVRDSRPMTDAERALTALPLIGLERAQAILKHCGGAAWALQWLTDLRVDKSERVPGVGESIKRAARTALGLSSEQNLAVVAKDGEESNG